MPTYRAACRVERECAIGVNCDPTLGDSPKIEGALEGFGVDVGSCCGDVVAVLIRDACR